MEKLLGEIPLLKGWPPHLLRHLATATELLKIPPNSQLLRQGQENEHLYFLLKGQVSVFVDGALVNRLNTRGDLLGEMSLITKKAAGATILADDDVEVLKVDSTKFLNQVGTDRELSISILYRIYATVLAEKLSNTNQKAKHFEDLSIKLNAAKAELADINADLERKVEERTQTLEQQNAELQAGTRKMEELLNNKKALFSKLSDLSKEQLSRLSRFLDKFRHDHPNQPEVNDARKVLFEIKSLVEPLVERFSIEQAMNSKRVLYADGNKKQQIIAKMALGGTGVILDTALTLDEGRQLMQQNDYDLVLFDSAFADLANQMHEKRPQMQLVLVTNDKMDSVLGSLKTLKSVPQIVSRNEEDRLFTVKNISTTVAKLLAKDLFGLDKYMSWGVDIKRGEVSSSEQRTEAIGKMNQYLESLGVRKIIRERACAVAEEMLMNAIYDAPTDANGKPLFNHLDRKQAIELPKNHTPVRLGFATDGVLVGVSVEDAYGSLEPSVVIRYLERNHLGFENGANEPGKGGAGRGLHQILELSDLVIFNVQAREKTEVISLFNIDQKDKAQLSSSFHLFRLSA